MILQTFSLTFSTILILSIVLAPHEDKREKIGTEVMPRKKGEEGRMCFFLILGLFILLYSDLIANKLNIFP